MRHLLIAFIFILAAPNAFSCDELFSENLQPIHVPANLGEFKEASPDLRNLVFIQQNSMNKATATVWNTDLSKATGQVKLSFDNTWTVMGVASGPKASFIVFDSTTQSYKLYSNGKAKSLPKLCDDQGLYFSTEFIGDGQSMLFRCYDGSAYLQSLDLSHTEKLMPHDRDAHYFKAPMTTNTVKSDQNFYVATKNSSSIEVRSIANSSLVKAINLEAITGEKVETLKLEVRNQLLYILDIKNKIRVIDLRDYELVYEYNVHPNIVAKGDLVRNAAIFSETYVGTEILDRRGGKTRYKLVVYSLTDGVQEESLSVNEEDEAFVSTDGKRILTYGVGRIGYYKK